MRVYWEYGEFAVLNKLNGPETRIHLALTLLTLANNSYWREYSIDEIVEAANTSKKSFADDTKKFVQGNVIKKIGKGYRINPAMLYNGKEQYQKNHITQYNTGSLNHKSLQDIFSNKTNTYCNKDYQTNKEELINI